MTALQVVSGLVVNPAGNVLMGLRPMSKKRGGLWELPGGKVDPGEEPRDALAREWREELGISPVIIGAFIASTMLSFEVPCSIELYSVVYTSHFDDITPLAHVELGWFDARQMMEYQPCSPAFYLHYPWIRDYLGIR